MSETKKVSIDKLKPNPDNPRIIKDDKFKKLVQSIKDFPEMLKLRPIVVDKDMVVLGGNMRLRALKDAGVKEVEVIIADNLTDDQKREFIIKDNVGFGEWNWETLANEWDAEQLGEWGLDLPSEKIINEQDLFDIEIPFYTPVNENVTVDELAILDKTNKLLSKIESIEMPEELKKVLRIRAGFFTDFNFQKIADYYAKQPTDVQEIFKDLGMVILSPKEALEKGFIELSNYLLEE